MSNVIINDTHLINIADVIRSKNGTDTKYKPSEMASAINNIVTGENINDYFDTTLIDDNRANGYLINRLIIKLPYMDFSEVTNMSYAFSRFSALEELQELDCSKASNINAMFANCSSLRKMGGLKNLGMGFPKSSAANTTNCTLNLTNTLLDYESLMNIINKVYDIKSLGIASQTIRLSSEELALLSDEDIAIAVTKGWNVTT